MALLRLASFAIVLFLDLHCALAAPNCAKELADAQLISSSIKITLDSSSPTKAGSSFSIKWLPTQPGSLAAPIYLVVATEEDTRFAGTGFLALTPGANAPRDITYATERSRAFVPLHWQLEVGSGGEVKVLPQSARSYDTTVAIVYAGNCGERLLSEARYPVPVVAGSASVVVQDRFSTAAPLQATMSLNRKHILRVFADRFEVSNASTGDIVLAGAGRDLNFSPTGRFLAAKHTADGAFDVFDLSGQPKPLHLLGYTQDMDSLIWANHDSYLIMSHQKWGGLDVFNTTVDAEAVLNGIDDCTACSGADSSFVVLDLDRGLAATVSNKSYGEIMVSDLYRRLPMKLLDRQDAQSYVRSNFDADFQQFSTTWDLGSDPQLSHYSGWEPSLSEIQNAKGKGQKVTLIDARIKFQEQAKRIIRHAPLPTAESNVHPATANQVAGTFRSGRAIPAVRRSHSVGGPQQNIEDRLFQVGVRLAPPKSINLVYQNKFPQPPTILKQLNSLASPIRSALDTSVKNPIFADDSCIMVDKTDLFTEADRIYRWDRDAKVFWIINTQCRQGSANILANNLYLVTQTGRSFEVFDLHSSFAASGGAWADGAERVSAYPLTDSLIAFASPIKDMASIRDLTSPNNKGPEIKLINPALISSLRLTNDLRHLIQINSDGRIFMTRISDGTLLLTGAYVDDEIVVSTESGFYDATFEGAQLVNVKFSGVNGTYRFDQFEPALFRPGLATMMISGRLPEPPAAIAAPPSAMLYLEREEQAGKRNGSVKITSQGPIKEVRLFVDGRLTATTNGKPGNHEASFSIDDPGPGHWISAIAVDSRGFASLPSAVKIPGKFVIAGKLNAVLVGVDNYADSRISQLQQAKYDARNIAGALASLNGQTFSQVNGKLLLDADATRERVLSEIRIAAEQTAENDRLVIYFAGHGVDGKDYGDPDSNLYLVGPNTSFDNVRETATPWKLISEALASARGTVIVMLDTCHSGFAGKREPLSNDESAKAMLTRSGAPILVLAASKGRQLSEESSVNGGHFTNAMAATIRKSLQVKEPTSLTEFYGSVKSTVMKETNNRQTPWMVRAGLIGEMSLF